MRTILAVLALAGLSFAADPLSIVATPAATAAPAVNQPVALDADRFLWLSIPGYADELTFDVTGGEAVTIFPVKSGAGYPGKLQGEAKHATHIAPKSASDVLMVFGESAGVVTIAAWGMTPAVKDSKGVVIQKSKPVKISTITLAVAGARPPPKPGPAPTPPKPDDDDRKLKPEPTGLGAWVIVVEDLSERTEHTIKLLGENAFWDSLDAKGHATRFYSKNAPDLPKGAYRPGDKLPMILICSKKGAELFRGEITPETTTAGIAKTVAETTGVK